VKFLDASVGASGPHDFAVRKSALSSAAPPASIASQPYVRDDRETPLCVGRDGEGYAGDLGQKGTGIFLRMGLDGPNQIERKGEFSFAAQDLRSSVGQDLIEIGSDRGVARMSAARCGVKLAIDSRISLRSSGLRSLSP
jgi:hypothetical protein